MEVFQRGESEFFVPYLAIELIRQRDGEIRVYLHFVLGDGILRILGRKDDEIPIADRQVLIKEIDPAIIAIDRQCISGIEWSDAAAVTDESLCVIARPGIGIAIIDPGRGTYVKIMMVARIKSSEFQYLQGVEIFAVSADRSIVVPVAAVYKRPSDEDSLLLVRGDEIELLDSSRIQESIRQLEDIPIIAIAYYSRDIIHVGLGVPSLPIILSERLLSRQQAS